MVLRTATWSMPYGWTGGEAIHRSVGLLNSSAGMNLKDNLPSQSVHVGYCFYKRTLAGAHWPYASFDLGTGLTYVLLGCTDVVNIFPTCFISLFPPPPGSCQRRPDARALASRDLVLRATSQFVLPGPRIGMPLNKHLTQDIVRPGATALRVNVRPHLYLPILVLQVHLRVVLPIGSGLA